MARKAYASHRNKREHRQVDGSRYSSSKILKQGLDNSSSHSVKLFLSLSLKILTNNEEDHSFRFLFLICL